jgi:hypothetical protein
VQSSLHKHPANNHPYNTSCHIASLSCNKQNLLLI